MKKALYLVLALLLLVVGALVSLTFLVSADEIKQTLISQVKQKTGRDLQIDGAVAWSFYPSVGVSIEQVRLLNPSGFPDKATLVVGRGRIGVALMPLFSQQIHIDQLELDQPQIHLYQLDDGHTNIDDFLNRFSRPAGSSPPAVTDGEQGQVGSGYQFKVAGILVRDGTLSFTKVATQQTYSLQHLHVKTGLLTPNQPLDIELSTDFLLDSLQGHLATQARLQPGQSGQDWTAKAWTLDLLLQPDAATRLQLNSRADVALSREGAQQTVTLSPWVWSAQLTSQTLQGQWQNQGRLMATWGNTDPQIRFDEWQLSGTQDGKAIPPTLASIQAQGNWRYDSRQRQLSLHDGRGQLGELKWQGSLDAFLAPIPKILFSISIPAINMDWFGVTADKSKAKPSSSAAAKEQEPDLRGLRQLNLEGRADIGRLTGPRLALSDVKVAIKLQDGLLDITDFSAGVYQGVVAMTGQLDARTVPARLQLVPRIRAIQLQPLLREWTGKEPVSGAATAQGKLSMLGLLPKNIRSSVAGDLNVVIHDGAVNGINLAAMLRDAKAAIKGQTSSGAPRKTDFSALTADIRLGQGKATSTNIAMMSPLLRVKGSGYTHLVKETLDFHFDVAVVATSKGQGGQDLSDLHHVTIPLRVSGGWSNPDYALDMQSLFKQDLQQRIQKQLPQKLPGKLGSLFN